jgi:4-hydroxyacetophenone monooxygenase
VREVTSQKPFTDAEQAEIRAGVEIANLPSLLMVLYQFTMDQRWLSPPYLPSRTRGMEDNDNAGLPEDLQHEIRVHALEAILARGRGRPASPVQEPTEAELAEMLSVAVGEPIPAEYGPFISEELVAAGVRSPEPGVTVTPVGTLPAEMGRPPEGFSVLVVGAGVSGLTVGFALGAAGIPFTIVERNDHIGGTWWENRYPGAGVDTPNHLYSWPGLPYDWSQFFALRDEVHGYLEDVARRVRLLDRIRFGTTVRQMVFDEELDQWDVIVESSPGGLQTLHASVVISAVGTFNRPFMPDLPGLASFGGEIFHTARWPEEFVPDGKRIAVIGNGASAMQVVPEIAAKASELTVFQRSPQWAAPFDKFQVKVPGPIRDLCRLVPEYQAWYRAKLTWTYNDKLWPTLIKDPEWPHPERSINRINDRFRETFTNYIKSELGDRQDLIEKSIPTYPPYGKRILFDNGWWRTLRQPHVTLETGRIAAVTADGVSVESGRRYAVDAIVLATGFEAVRYLSTIDVITRSGRHLRDVWEDDNPRAYLGTVIPDVPNFFCMYGPNLQPGHGGSFMTIASAQMYYVMSILDQVFKAGVGTFECKQDKSDEYNDEIDREHERRIWTHPGMDTYYRNAKGRVVVNSGLRVIDFFTRTRSARLSDFVTTPARNSEPRSADGSVGGGHNNA